MTEFMIGNTLQMSSIGTRGEVRSADMTDIAHQSRRRALARRILASQGGTAADPAAVAVIAIRAYDNLARVLALVVGTVGVAAMTNRALRLATRDFPWLLSREPGSAEIQFTQVVEALKRQEPALAIDAAAAILAAVLTLLDTLIGKPLAAQLVQQAWPDVSLGAGAGEKA